MFSFKLKKKLSGKKGGFKEVLYDNVAVIVVIILIAVTLVAMSTKMKNIGENTAGVDGKPGEGIISTTLEKMIDTLDTDWSVTGK